jgi:site-specific DNA-methyltransferase (adenine-specific)
VMARKFIEGTNKNNREKYGTGGINIDGCRVRKEILEEQIAGRSNKIGTFERKDMITPKREGRFPANVMHDGSDVVQDIFPNSKGSSGNGNAKVGETSKGAIPLRRGEAPLYNDEGSASRYFYCPKTAKSERNQGLIEFDDKQYSHDGRKKSIENPYQRNKSISKNSHPTVKPVELMKYLCRLVTPKGGTVLDPFMGSGSTGMAAKDEGFDFIGIEREKEYFEISEQRIKTTAPLSEFFA